MFYNNLGNVYFKMKRWDEAAEHLNFAVELFRQTENGIDLGNSLGTFGLVYKNKGINKKALPAFEEAIPLLEMFPESQFAKKLLEDFVPAYEQRLADGWVLACRPIAGRPS
mgnify:CR=1 FL=1